MSEIAKNEWRYGVVPKLHNDAVVMKGGDDKSRPMRPWLVCRYGELIPRACEQWYAILSTEPPKMPEPELRLPEGWSVNSDGPVAGSEEYIIRVIRHREGRCTRLYSLGFSRRECVEEINRILEGK